VAGLHQPHNARRRRAINRQPTTRAKRAMTTILHDMSHRDFAFIQTAPGRVFIGWGPFEQLPFRRPERPAFFIADFFLDDPQPWRHPATWEELALEELAARFPDAEPPRVEWERAPVEDFERTFASARAAFDRGDFKKIVPILFESGRLARGEHWRWFFERL